MVIKEVFSFLLPLEKLLNTFFQYKKCTLFSDAEVKFIAWSSSDIYVFLSSTLKMQLLYKNKKICMEKDINTLKIRSHTVLSLAAFLLIYLLFQLEVLCLRSDEAFVSEIFNVL